MHKLGRCRVLVMFFALSVLCLGLVVLVLAGSDTAVWPDPSGEDVRSNGKLVIDCSHGDIGYVMVRSAQETGRALKLRVSYVNPDLEEDDEGKYGQLIYNINNKGEFEPIPLQLGSGYYEFSLFENVKGTKYSAEGKVALSVELEDENAAFLVPNQYVNYDPESETVKKSDELCEGLTPAECYEAICDFMASEFSYDFVRATTISPGTLPEVDPSFEKRSGICQDMSAVMVTMLRVQGIPAQLVIGYVDQYYHAWTVAIVDGEERFFDPTVAVGALTPNMKYSVERKY